MLAVGFGVEWHPQTAEHVQFLAVGFERFQLDRHVPIGPRLLRNPQRGRETAAPEKGVESRGQRPAIRLSLTLTVQETVDERQPHYRHGALALAAAKVSAVEPHRLLRVLG